MQLRFKVDQAEAFRRGIDCPKSVVSLNVNPSEIDKEIRSKIADRLLGINVCFGEATSGRTKPKTHIDPESGTLQQVAMLIVARGPSLEDLAEAVELDSRLLLVDSRGQEFSEPSVR